MFLKKFLDAWHIKRNWRALIKPANDHYRALDGIRALSLVHIVLFHSFVVLEYFFKHNATLGSEKFLQYLSELPWWLRWIWHGDTSVDVFFVLSGFLIGCMLFKEYQRDTSINIKRFYWHRFLRLTPVYFFAVFYMANFGLENNTHLWANLVYLNNFVPFDQAFMVWTWSLAVEEQFYVIMPAFLLLVFFRSGKPLFWFAALFILSILIRLILLAMHTEFLSEPAVNHMFLSLPGYRGEFNTVMYDNLYTRFGAFIPGIAAAYAYVYHKAELTRFFARTSRANGLLVVALLICFAMNCLPKQDPTFVLPAWLNWLYLGSHRQIFSLLVAYILVFCLFPSGAGRLFTGFLGWRVWYPLAQLSYSIYLFHVPFVVTAYVIARAISGNGQSAEFSMWENVATAFITFVLCGIWCSILYLLIEKPFMNLRSRHPTAGERKNS